MTACRFLKLMILTAVIALLVPGRVLAQEATPTAVYPEPSDCTIQPRTIDELIALVGEAPPAIPGANEGDDEDEETEDEENEATPFEVPAGTPADQETIDAINDVLWMGRACLNAGDFPRFMALFSDAYIQANFPPLGPDEIEFLNSEPEPVPVDEREAFIPVEQVIVMADGRVGAVIPEGDADDYGIFTLVDGVWFIDEDIPDFVAVNATPTS